MKKIKKTYASIRKPCFRSSKIPNLVFTSFVSMLGPKPEDPSDLSPPDELSQARQFFFFRNLFGVPPGERPEIPIEMCEYCIKSVFSAAAC